MKMCSKVFVSRKAFSFLKGTIDDVCRYIFFACYVYGCEACVVCIYMPSKRRRRPSAKDEPDMSLIVCPTSEMLSQKMYAWVFDRLYVSHYIASQLRTSPASSRLLMVRLPDLNSSFTFCGHSDCQIMGPILFRPDVHTSPMPIPQLSESPM